MSFEFNQELIDTENELETAQIRKKKINNRLESLKQSKDYSNFEALQKQKAELESQISHIKHRFNNTFKGIDKAVKKYKKGSLQEELLDQYMDDPLLALMEDQQFIILEILEKIKKEIDNLELKQKDKILKNIRILSNA